MYFAILVVSTLFLVCYLWFAVADLIGWRTLANTYLQLCWLRWRIFRETTPKGQQFFFFYLTTWIVAVWLATLCLFLFSVQETDKGVRIQLVLPYDSEQAKGRSDNP